jgi:2-keto-3-deoxy-L-fuconate dehydrogenase
MGCLVTADEVANAVVYLASPLSSSTMGILLSVDGGMAGIRVPITRVAVPSHKEIGRLHEQAKPT